MSSILLTAIGLMLAAAAALVVAINAPDIDSSKLMDQASATQVSQQQQIEDLLAGHGL